MKRHYLCIRMHLGLGDTIICAPIVRAKAKLYELVCIMAKHHNIPSTEYLFRDCPNVVIRGVCDDEEADMFVRDVWRDEVLRLGMFNHPFDGNSWDTEFYRHAGVEFTDRWNRWECPRDEKSEEKIFHQAVPQYGISTRYRVFVHDDPSRGMKIMFGPKWTEYNERLTEMDGAVGCDILAPINISTPILFHWRKVIEACDEIHCIPSSFAAFIDSIALPKQPKLFLHHYTRLGEPLMKLHHSWEVLK